MFLDEQDKIQVEDSDTHGILDAGALRLINSLHGKKFLRRREVAKIDRTIIHREGGWSTDQDGIKTYEGPETLTEFTTRSDDSEFYAFMFWVQMYIFTRDANLFFTKCEPWVRQV